MTVGKPGTFTKKGQNRPMTVGVRLNRLENMVRRLKFLGKLSYTDNVWTFLRPTLWILLANIIESYIQNIEHIRNRKVSQFFFDDDDESAKFSPE